MGKKKHPHRGSMQFWPRKRARYSLARVRSWAEESKVKPLGFVGYKAGMTQLRLDDSRPKSLTKGQTIVYPTTIVECPPMVIFGVVFYKNKRKFASILHSKLAKELKKKIQLPKKQLTKMDEIKEFDDLKLLIHTTPKLTGIGTKKPKISEIALGGAKEEKLSYAQENLGKEIKIEDVFENGVLVDLHGITIGKGFQGTVKRYGVQIRQHKSEKTKRGIGNLGGWTPKRVDFRVQQPGKMGYHLRTEYNKQILKIGNDGENITPKGGKNRYGVIKNSYVLVKGSIPGPKKRAVVITQAIRPNKSSKEGLEV
ncbi:MAG: 50S ribosomal protein L3, partial [Nanoarchaeota archaeon]|nr:50S ribosomal protein L3 [Nanoarchaeota archaeon]